MREFTEKYDDGSIRAKYTKDNDLFQGEYIEYFQTGNIGRIRNFDKGKLNGEFLTYYGNQNIKTKTNYNMDELDGKAIAYYENGNIEKESHYNNGKIIGVTKLYHDNGQLKVALNFSKPDIQDDGEVISYHPNGVVAKRSNISNGLLNGDFKEWYDNGQIKTEGYYIDKVCFIKKEWWGNGNLKREVSYKNNETFSEIFWSDSGEKVKERHIFSELIKFLESLKSYEKSTNEINIEIVPEELSVWEDEEWDGEIEGEFFTFKAITTYRHPRLGLELDNNEEKLKKFLNLLNKNGIKDLDSSKFTDCEFWINLNSSSGQFTEVISDSIKFENDIDSEQKEDFCSILTDEETDLWEYAEVDEGIISFEKGSIKKIILAINNNIFELNV